MNVWLATILPMKLIKILPSIALIIVGLVVEKHYVGRITIFANAVALATFFALVQDLPIWLIVYINVVTILGIIAFFSYLLKLKLPQQFYFAGGWAASVISGIILLFYLVE